MKLKFFIGVALLALVTGLIGQTAPAPFLSIPVQGATTFAASNMQYSTISVACAFGTGAALNNDPLAGQTLQISYASTSVYTTGMISKGSVMALGYGDAGFVMMQDANGAGVGWHIKNSGTPGFTLNKANAGYSVEYQLQGPFWLGDPPANVSPTLVQMMNAGSATLVLQLQNTSKYSFGDLEGVGRKGKLAGYSTFGFVSNGYVNLYH